VSIKEKDGQLYISAPYNPLFVEELKAKTKTRKWDSWLKVWIVSASEKQIVQELINKHFSSNHEEKYAQIGDIELYCSSSFVDYPRCSFMRSFVAKLGSSVNIVERGEGVARAYVQNIQIQQFIKQKVQELLAKQSQSTIYVYVEHATEDTYVITFSRDTSAFKKSPLFEGLKRVRFANHGTRRAPEFHGIIAIASRFPLNVIDGEKEDFIDLPDTPEIRVKVCEILERASDWDSAKQSLLTLKEQIPQLLAQQQKVEVSEVSLEEEIERLKAEIEELERLLAEKKAKLQQLAAEKVKLALEEIKAQVT